MGDIASARLKESDFDEGEGKMEPCVLLEELSHAFHALPDTIANDQQQKSSALQIPGDGIVK